MKRRTLDITFALGGALFSVLLLVLGLVLKNQSDFAQSYVKDQLGAQQIYFQPTASLGDEMKNVACLSEFGQGGPADHGGGQLLTTGKMAECYANKYIAAHMAGAAKGAGYEGATYATMGKFTMKGSGAADSVSLVDQLAAAKATGDQTKIDAAQASLDKAAGLRGTLLTGETLRGLLLTSYGFSIFGDKADLAATVCYIAFALLLVLSIAGLVHGLTSKHAKDQILAVEHKG
jgi:hypothetical protein